VDGFLEILRAESTTNETFIDAAGSAHEAERKDSEPKSPVENLRWVIKVLEFKDIDRFLYAPCHFESEGWKIAGV
jgi:hypothetical protein